MENVEQDCGHVSAKEAPGRWLIRASGLSHHFAAYVEALLLLDEIDEDGCPVWAADRPSMKGSAPASATNVSEMLTADPR